MEFWPIIAAGIGIVSAGITGYYASQISTTRELAIRPTSEKIDERLRQFQIVIRGDLAGNHADLIIRLNEMETRLRSDLHRLETRLDDHGTRLRVAEAKLEAMFSANGRTEAETQELWAEIGKLRDRATGA